MICSNCRRRLRNDATSCLCGKFGQESQIRRAHIACCFAGCPESAMCSIFTNTGWANVCMTHYPQVKPASKSYAYNSPACVEARKVYENSFDYRRRHGIVKAAPDRASIDAELEEVRRKMTAAMERQPGEDPQEPALGIGRDPLEEEFADRANP